VVLTLQLLLGVRDTLGPVALRGWEAVGVWVCVLLQDAVLVRLVEAVAVPVQVREAVWEREEVWETVGGEYVLVQEAVPDALANPERESVAVSETVRVLPVKDRLEHVAVQDMEVLNVALTVWAALRVDGVGDEEALGLQLLVTERVGNRDPEGLPLLLRL